MLVFLSDTHLTDGTSGETINSGAFKKFALYLEDMVLTARAEEIEIVLLGDIFDLIRSDYWLMSDIRPWSEEGDTDEAGKGLKNYVMDIVERICKNPVNMESAGHIKDFKEKMASKGIDVRLTYITGNHDWLINRFSDARVYVAGFLGLDDEVFKKEPFPEQVFWDDYRVFARHGDIYDPFNFDGKRDASSLGDAIVIELVNRFPRAVEERIGSDTDPILISRLKEIDNVRPLVDIPLWIQGACRRAKSQAIAEEVKEVWNELVDDFLEIEFVRRHDRPWRMDIVDALEIGLGISRYLSLKDIVNLPLRRFHMGDDDYVNRAFQEDYVKRNEAEFVLYGHTHHYRIDPLDIITTPEGVLTKTYFNTGTWRKIHVRARFDLDGNEFSGWHVMTFVAFYSKGERRNKRFEVWNGALG